MDNRIKSHGYLLTLAFVTMAFALGSVFTRAPLAASEACTSDVVADYGADRTGKRDSTIAFTLALNKAPGPNLVCVPAGEYAIGNPAASQDGVILPHEITIAGPSAFAGGALIGPLSESATIIQYDRTAHIIDSCPVEKLTSAVPASCGTSAQITNAVRGWRFANLNLKYADDLLPQSQSATGPPSAIYFPGASHVDIQSVAIAGASNCVGLGLILLGGVPDGSNVTECEGRFLTVHGGSDPKRLSPSH